MPSSDITDSEKRYARAVNELRDALLGSAMDFQLSGDLNAALMSRYRAYALHPGISPVLHSIGQVYEAMGDSKSALLCHRGVVPESAEEEFFNAKKANIKLVSARRASNNQHHKIYSAEKIKLPLPVSNADSRRRPEFRALHTESRGSFVSVLAEGYLWFDGFNTLIMDSRRRILKEHIKGNPVVVTDVARQRVEKRIAGTVCFIDARSSSIYYHWMIDVLPKIALLKSAGIDIDSIDYFVVRCTSEFQRQTLQHLGIPLERVIPPTDDQMILADKLIVPFLKHDRGDRLYNGLGLGLARWVPTWLSQAFVSATIQENSPEKIYISRAQRGTRAPENEARLVDELQKRGFTSVFLEDLSVVQQANLMASALIVVAPHGAGLTNIAFCKPGTMVVEIFGDYVVPCYWALSTLANLNYHHYLATEAHSQLQVKPQSDGANDGSLSSLPGTSNASKSVDLATRRKLGIDLDVDDFIEKLDIWLNTADLA